MSKPFSDQTEVGNASGRAFKILYRGKMEDIIVCLTFGIVLFMARIEYKLYSFEIVMVLNIFDF